MANWQDVGQDNLNEAILLLDSKKYRSATSRFYYAAFSVLTFELIRRGASGDFRNNRATPGHTQLAGLTETWFTHMSEERRGNLSLTISELYRRRIASDYSLSPIDYEFARKAFRDAQVIFRYLEVRL